MTQELGHRIKNLIAMIQGIVNQSFRGADDIAAAKKAISDRLTVLSGAQDILLAGSTDGAQLADVVTKSVALAQDQGQGSRIQIKGPDVPMGPRAAMSLALVIHELLTNALKYGALSQLDGLVTISWGFSTLEGEPALEFTWAEQDGPAVVPPTRIGFGSRLVRSGITGTRSTVLLEFAPQGLQYRLIADLAGLKRD